MKLLNILDLRSWSKILVDGQPPLPRLDHSMCVAHMGKSDITEGMLLYILILTIDYSVIISARECKMLIYLYII